MASPADRSNAPPPVALARRLGTGDAVVVGLCAMVGAGVFVVFAPAAAAAGSGLLIGLLIAAVVATCNAIASAQLAMAYPTSGGTYVYGREVLGPWWGFLAGWGFVVGKTASCAAMSMAFAAYAVPEAGSWWQRGVAILGVLVLTAATLGGVTRTATVARVLLTLTLLTLGLFFVVAVRYASGASGGAEPAALAFEGSAYGVLQSAGLLFFAFAGYARIATLAEEVRRPETLGRAIGIALGLAIVVYAAVAVGLIAVLGSDLPRTATPIMAAVESAGPAWAPPVVQVGAAAAALGALLALLAGVSRTTLAMAREADLPRRLAVVHPRHQVPRSAQLAVAGAVVVLVLVADLRGAIGFSSAGVLIYYAVANLAAFRQDPAARRWPRWLNVLGLVGCLTLVATLPMTSVLIALLVLTAGVLGRLATRR